MATPHGDQVMGKLTIDNETASNTADLRRMVRSAEKYFDLVQDRTIVLRYARGRCMWGHAWARLGDKTPDTAGVRHEGRQVRVFMRRGFPEAAATDGQKEVDDRFIRNIFWLFFHELAHNRGMEHKDMGRQTALFKVWDQPDLPPCADDKPYQLRWKPKVAVAKPPLDLVTKRAARVEKKLLKWQRTLARVTKKIRSLKAQHRYYEKKLAEREVPLAIAAKESP